MKEEQRKQMEFIDSLVFAFQQGSEAAGEQLMRQFGCHPESERMTSYIGKYYNLIRHQRIDWTDADSRRFIGFEIGDPERRRLLHKAWQSKETRAEAVRALERISRRFEAFPEEDFKQDLRMLFLIQADRFKKIDKNIGFSGYLYKSYGQAVNNHMRDLMNKKKQETLMDPDLYVPLWDEEAWDETSDISVNESFLTYEPMLVLDDELGNSWMRGITCGEEFSGLTTLQRMILRLHYIDGISDRKIADKLNIHINTIFRQRKKAIEIVQQTHQELMEGDYDE